MGCFGFKLSEFHARALLLRCSSELMCAQPHLALKRHLDATSAISKVTYLGLNFLKPASFICMVYVRTALFFQLFLLYLLCATERHNHALYLKEL